MKLRMEINVNQDTLQAPFVVHFSAQHAHRAELYFWTFSLVSWTEEMLH